MKWLDRSSYQSESGQEHGKNALAALLLLCLLPLLLVACDWRNSSASNHRQTVQTTSGNTITYSTLPSDVLVRLFYGGGKIGKLELSPESTIYGDGSFITGPGLQLQQGTLTSETLQNLLSTLTSTYNLLQLHRQIFNDISDQNITLLQVALNGKNYQFVYGLFGHFQESTQDEHEYQQLGNAISTIRNTLNRPRHIYTAPQNTLLVYQTFRADFTSVQNQHIPDWTQSTISLANAAIYECGTIPPDLTGPNADNGCLTYSPPHVAILLDQPNLQAVRNMLHGKQENMFLENGNYYVVMLRPLLPDEIARQQVAMYGSNTQNYVPIPLKGGPIPIPTPSSQT